MYCRACQEQRLGTARFCAACGATLAPRDRREIEAELAHVQYLLAQLPRWDSGRVPDGPREYLKGRYQRVERVLLTALLESNEATAAGAALGEPPVALVPPPADATVEPSANLSERTEGATVLAFAEAAKAAQERAAAEARNRGDGWTADERATTGALPQEALGGATDQTGAATESARPADLAANSNEVVEEAQSAEEPAPGAPTAAARTGTTVGSATDARERAARAGPEAASGGAVDPSSDGHVAANSDASDEADPSPEAAFQVPDSDPRESQLISATSRWSEMWKPFLSESVGWFLGAFLILAGTFYFVAESWAGMTSLMRSLVVFGAAAVYSGGFALWGRLLGRREKLRSAGRILQLIGACAAPLSGLALQGLGVAFAVPLAALWAGATYTLWRGPAKAFADLESEPIPLLAAATTLLLGVAPGATSLGGAAIWLIALPLAISWWAVQRSRKADVKGEALTFVLLSTTGLVALAAVRIHVALAVAGHSPAFGSWAPFLAFFAAALLEARTPTRAADPLSIAVVAVQTGCIVLSAGGVAPSFFATSAVTIWTALRLSRGDDQRAGWMYAAYAAGYLAYQSVGQLMPGPLKELLLQLEAALGYGGRTTLPVAFDSVYALPYLVAGAVLALRAELRSLTDVFGEEWHRAVAKVLDRCTAVGGVLFSLLSLHRTDGRPALLTVTFVSALCLALGLWREKRELTWVGALLSVLLPWPLSLVGGTRALAVGAGAVALAIALTRWRWTTQKPDGRSLASAALATVAGIAGWTLHPGPVSLVAIALAAVALFVLARAKDEALLETAAVAGAASLVPNALLWLSAPYATLALAIAAVALAGLGWNGHAPSRPVALLSAATASVVQFGLAQDHGWASQPLALGLVLLVSAAAFAIVAIDWPAAGWGTVLLLHAAALPRTYELCSFSWLHSVGSGALYALLALAASVLTAIRGAKWKLGVSALLSIGCAVYAVIADSDAGHPLLPILLVAVTALAASRALPPWLTLPVMTLALLAAGWDDSRWHVVAAVALTALAGIDLRPTFRELLVGKHRLALVSAICGTVALGISIAEPAFDWPVMAALVVLLPLVWTCSSQVALFAAVPVPLLAWLTPEHRAMQWIAPAYAVVCTRALHHFEPVRRFLLADKEARAKQAIVAITLLLGSLSLVVWADGPQRPLQGWTLLALVASAGEPLLLRYALAGVLWLFQPEAPVVLTAALFAAAFLVHHAPRWGARLLGVEDRPTLRRDLTLLGLAASALPLLRAGEPQPLHLALPTVALFLSGMLLPQPWVWAGIPVGIAGTLCLALPGTSPIVLASLAVVVAAVVALALRFEVVREPVRRTLALLAPRLEGELSTPMWTGAVVIAAAGAAAQLGYPHPLTPSARVLTALAPVLLMLSPAALESAAASALVAASLWAFLPEPWPSVALAGFGAVLSWLPEWVKARSGKDESAAEAKRPLTHTALLHPLGWAFSLLAMLFLRSLGHLSTPLAVALFSLTMWGAVRGKPRAEWLGWLTTWATVHVSLLSWAVAHPTGKQVGFIFPYLAATSVLLAIVALLLPATRERRPIALLLSAVGIAEVIPAVTLLDVVAPREAWVATVALVLLTVLLVRRAVAEEDETAAMLSQCAVVVAYAVVRCLGFGVTRLGNADVLAAVVAGALAMGLSAWAARQGGGSAVFERPARLGAFVLPLVGLLLLPRTSAMTAASLLLATSAHFGALAVSKKARGLASALSVATFNAAVLVAWVGQGATALELYVLPAGLSLLALIAVFRSQLAPSTQARLRAVVVTAMYAVTAYRALAFEHSSAMFLCVFVCLVGVGAGIALRIRSYVYLGSAFLVTTVVANLVRYGVRDHRAGAVFLSLLGLMVVGFMILVTAQREELLARYSKLKAMLSQWEG